jgi:DNA-binding winged helix-turn-helix (wHTH) protein
MYPAGKAEYLSFGNFQLNLEDRVLLQAGLPVPLRPKEFETLRLLVERSPHLVTKEEFVSRLWPNTFVGDSSLARNISVLRKVLGEDLIEIVAKRGYRFTEVVRQSSGPQLNEGEGSPITDKNWPSTERVPPPIPAKWKLVSAAGLSLIIMGLITFW